MTEATTLAGQPATRYDCRHCDRPLCSRMTSFIVARGDRWLALEFRSQGALNRLDQRILALFNLLPAKTSR